MKKTTVSNLVIILTGMSLFFVAIHYLLRGHKLTVGADVNSSVIIPIPGSTLDDDIILSPVETPEGGAPNVAPPNLASRAATMAIGAAADAAGTILHPSDSLKATDPLPNAVEPPSIKLDHTYQDRSAEVVLVNEALAYYGESVNPDSPVFSYFTVMAVKNIQQSHSIRPEDPEYGQVGAKTRPILNQALAILIDLKVNPAVYIPADVQFGQRGGGAYALNLALEKQGYYSYSGFVFSNKTRSLLSQFQIDHKLPSTGQVDAATLTALQK